MTDLRNSIAYTVCNFFINYVAVGPYRMYLKAVYALGTQAFDREFWKQYEQTQEEGELDADT